MRVLRKNIQNEKMKKLSLRILNLSIEIYNVPNMVGMNNKLKLLQSASNLSYLRFLANNTIFIV